MERKDRIDAFGASSLVAFSLLLAVNQVVIKLIGAGLQPVFAAGLRSAGAAVFLGLMAAALRRPLRLPPGTVPGLLLIGLCFSAEFLFLFIALDLTTVGRASIIFYSMPVWLSLGAHFLLHGERMSTAKAAGLALAMAGVAWAILHRPAGQASASLVGDLCALVGAVGWAGLSLALRATRAREAGSHVQLMAMLVVSAVVLLGAAPFFGPLVRSPDGVTWAGMAFQIVVIATLGFLFYTWLLKIYPASGVASFSFLTPVFAVFLGWTLLDEPLGPSTFGALACVALGLVLINRRR